MTGRYAQKDPARKDPARNRRCSAAAGSCASGFIPLPRLPDGRLEPRALAAAIGHGFSIVRWHVGAPGQG